MTVIRTVLLGEALRQLPDGLSLGIREGDGRGLEEYGEMWSCSGSPYISLNTIECYERNILWPQKFRKFDIPKTNFLQTFTHF